MKKIINKDIAKIIAKNLMIDMDDNQIDKIILNVNKCVQDLEKINELKKLNYNLDNVEPMDFPDIQVNNSFRKDEVIDFKNKKELLEIASKKNKYLIKA